MHTESSEKYVCSCSVGYVEDREKELGGGNNAKVKDYIKCGHDKKIVHRICNLLKLHICM